MEVTLNWESAVPNVNLGRGPGRDGPPKGEPDRVSINASPPSLIQERPGRREIHGAPRFWFPSGVPPTSGGCHRG
jgi:hypothetical protein